MQRLTDYIAQFLIGQGVRDIFMLTGYGAMYLNDAIALSGINYYASRNEAAAPMMAEAYARVKQSLGAVCVTAGPGATNAVSGLAEAWVDSAPIIVFSGQVTRRHTTHNANVPGLRTFGTAEINIVPIVKNLTKYAAVIDEPTSVRYHLEKAVYYATTGRPGPVWLDIPLDVQQALIDPSSLDGFIPPKERWFNTNLTAATNSVIKLLLRAKRPVLVCGHGIRQGGAISEWRNLVDLLNMPVIFSRLGLDLMPHSHPNVFGMAGIKGSRYCKFLMNEADLVISLGSRLAVPFVGHDLEAFAPGAKIVMVDIDKAELSKPGVHIDLPIHADIKPFTQELLKAIDNEKLPDWGGWIESCRELTRKCPILSASQKRNPIDLYYFMSRIDALSQKHHILVTDAGSNYYVGGQVWRFENARREITSSAYAAMGLSIPLAIGASIADKKSQVLAITGDGSLELNIQELKTLSHYNLNIKLFVINNGGYVSMRNWQDTVFEGRRIDTEATTGAGTLNLRKVAEAFNLDYLKIEKHEEIDEKLKQVMSNDSPIFVEVITDYNQKILEPFDR
ncbi:MAG: thiamine pyrophosphate-binding protein [Candidatus Omnitrophota bacterium]|nr:MAG: thiamine pyrophosphate-binding protein [Candidatus Omnitrophota bacterium]